MQCKVAGNVSVFLQSKACLLCIAYKAGDKYHVSCYDRDLVCCAKQ